MSYKDEVSLNMMASSTVKECEGEDFNNVIYYLNDKRLLRTSAIYGANGSGKSTVVAALNIFKLMVLSSFVDDSLTKSLSSLHYHFDVHSGQEPVSMQCVFIANNVKYRLGFEVRAGKVVSEWLYLMNADASKESYCFKREGDELKVNSKLMKGAGGIAAKTRSDALFITTAAQFNVTIAKKVKEWFRDKLNILSGLDENTLALTAREVMQNSDMKNLVLQFLAIVDPCIKDVNVTENIKEKTSKGTLINVLSHFGIKQPSVLDASVKVKDLEILSTHDLYNDGDLIGIELLNFQFESMGTNKLFALLGPFFNAIQNGGVLVVDEFGASLHTQLSVELLKLFHSKINKNCAQLIVTTHDTNLLRKDLLRRDQIWFAEKKTNGVSDLYSLVEYKINQANSVRNDASFSKDYLMGKYGAIPYFGNIAKFVSEYGKQEG